MERLILQRLDSHRLLRSDLRDPAAVVAWFGAVQAQDFGGAKWSIGQRTHGLTDQSIEDAFNVGSILRTHVLRPTWHFVTPADIGWMLALTAPRIQRFNAHAYKQFELDVRTLARGREILARALEGGESLTRAELAAALRHGRVMASGPRLGLLTIDAELHQVMCSGPLRGRQFTYVRFDERVPRSKMLSREDALAALTRRYFASHGPATLKDFAWWSGLTMTDVKAAVALGDLRRETIDDVEYWGTSSTLPGNPRTSRAHLLPTYDEYLIAYKDRTPIGASSWGRGGASAYVNHLAMDGLVCGSWRPRVGKQQVTISVKHAGRPDANVSRAVARAAALYGRFLGKAVAIEP